MTRGRRSLAWFVAHAGHLAVWLGLYFTAAYVAAVLVLGKGVSATAALSCFCAGVGLYLLDRVKVRDAWLDPADRVAQPERFDFLLARREIVRSAAWGVLACGTFAAALTDIRNLALPPIGIAGVVIYSSLRRTGNRLKDILLVKNLLPGLSIAGLAVIFAWQSPPDSGDISIWPIIGVLAGLSLLVAVDAMLCDLDDMASDADCGTHTVPTVLGQTQTWFIALVLHALAGGFLVAASAAVGVADVAAWIAGGNLVATLVLFALRLGKVRDLVDLKLPIVVGLVWVLVWVCYGIYKVSAP